MEKVAFSNVDVRALPAVTGDTKPVLHSTLETITVSFDRSSRDLLRRGSL